MALFTHYYRFSPIIALLCLAFASATGCRSIGSTNNGAIASRQDPRTSQPVESAGTPLPQTVDLRAKKPESLQAEENNSGGAVSSQLPARFPKKANKLQPDKPRIPDLTGKENPPTEVRQVRYQTDLSYLEQPTFEKTQQQAPGEEVVPAQPATQTKWSLTDLEGIALQNNPALTEAAANVEAAQGNWLQVGLYPNPRIGYFGEEIGDEGSGGKQGGFVAQQIVTGNKLGLNREAASWEVQQREIELEAIRLRVLTDVRIHYYSVLVAQRKRELATKLVTISEQGLQTAQALFKAEEVSQADPLRAQVQLDSTKILLQTTTNQHLEAWRRLAAVLGLPTMEIQHIDGRLNPESIQLNWQSTLQDVLSRSPEIAAAAANVQRARWNVERAHAEVVPDLNVNVGVAKNDINNDTITNVSLSLPLPILNRNQGNIYRAESVAAAAERAVDRIALNLQARLAAAYQRYETARNQATTYSRKGGILDNANQTLKLIQSGYQAEEYNLLDLLNAQRTYFQTNITYLDALGELYVAIAEIQGLLLRGSLAEQEQK